MGAYTFSPSAGSIFASQSPAQRANSCILQAMQLHPEFANEVMDGISVSWPKVPFQLGAWGASPAGVLLTADEQIYFAGEHLSPLQGWQEGAILSAYNAIDLIVQQD